MGSDRVGGAGGRKRVAVDGRAALEATSGLDCRDCFVRDQLSAGRAGTSTAAVWTLRCISVGAGELVRDSRKALRRGRSSGGFYDQAADGAAVSGVVSDLDRWRFEETVDAPRGILRCTGHFGRRGRVAGAGLASVFSCRP